MPIDVDTVRSPGWWLQRLTLRLQDPSRQARLNLLDATFRGDPPLPVGAENARETYRAFQRYARSNFAELVVESCRERMTPVGLRTSVESDETGDAVAWRVWRRAGLDVESAEVHRTMLALGDAYVIVGAADSATGVPTITAEDPRQVITEHDPRQQRRITAALKLFVDDVDDVELAYLFLPGALFVAQRPLERSPMQVSGPTSATWAAAPGYGFDPAAWSWREDLSGRLPAGLMPVTRFRNSRGVGEFEPHLDLLMRINHMILQRMVIATLQAFRQRGVIGLPNTTDGLAALPDGSNVIDYNDVFAADPGSLWMAPAGTSFWESGQLDLTPILVSVRDDLKHLSAVSRTPMYALDPGGENQSAEGASLAREGLVYRASDRIMRADDGWVQVMGNAFRWMGDEARADPAGLSMLWQPTDRPSLAERADAASKATDLPWRSKMIHIWGFSPAEVDEMESQRAADLLFAPTTTASAASSAPAAALGAAGASPALGS